MRKETKNMRKETKNMRKTCEKRQKKIGFILSRQTQVSYTGFAPNSKGAVNTEKNQHQTVAEFLNFGQFGVFFPDFKASLSNHLPMEGVPKLNQVKRPRNATKSTGKEWKIPLIMSISEGHKNYWDFGVCAEVLC